MRMVTLCAGIALLALACHRSPLAAKRTDASAAQDQDSGAGGVTLSIPDADVIVASATQDQAGSWATPDVGAAVDGNAVIVPDGATIVASGQASPGVLALDDQNLYWIDLGIAMSGGPKVAWWQDGAVMKCPKAGCPKGPTALASGRNSISSFFATDGDYVFWSDAGPTFAADDAGMPGGLLRCSVAGCGNAPERLDELGGSTLAVAGGKVFVAGRSAEVVWCPISGCASPPAVLWSGDQTTSNTVTVELATDGSDVYWTTMGMVMRCAQAGCDGNPTVLVPYSTTFWNFGVLALDDTNVYFSHGLFDNGGGALRPGEILACAKAGCAGSPRVLATNLNPPTSLATDGIDVYWSQPDGPLLSTSLTSVVCKCPAAGCNGTPITIAAGMTGSVAVAVDNDFVYWTDGGASDQGGDGRIWRAPK